MRALTANIFDNPILLRELRRRMRGKALIWSIMIYIAIMTISTIIVLLAKSPPPGASISMDTLRALHATGTQIFWWITGLQSLLVLIIAPTITAGMTTGEKERKTFDFLRVTTITRWMYVLGCFLSTSFYVGLALLCALPLISLSFLYGGVSLEKVVQTFFLLMAGSCVLSSFGLYISSVCERTRTAQGIIVFLIFAMLFGGFLLIQISQAAFAGATGVTAGTAGSAMPGYVYIFNYGIPDWVMTVLGLGLLSTIFLLLAARKLFEPEEMRAFSHWQFGLLYVAVIAVGLGLLSGNAFSTEMMELSFMASVYVLMLSAVVTFAVGRMEVGDEIWHLKRLFPFLRPFDQTIPFLVAVAALGWYTFAIMPDLVKPLNVAPGLPFSLGMVAVSSFAFFAFFARGVTGVTGSRNKAGLMTIVLISLATVVWPLLIAVCNAAVPDIEPVWRQLLAFSPFAMLFDSFNNPSAYQTGVPVGVFAAAIYAALAVGVGIYGEYARWKRWRGFDYHYDMPVG
jgi:hypothetical protein